MFGDTQMCRSTMVENHWFKWTVDLNIVYKWRHSLKEGIMGFNMTVYESKFQLKFWHNERGKSYPILYDVIYEQSLRIKIIFFSSARSDTSNSNPDNVMSKKRSLPSNRLSLMDRQNLVNQIFLFLRFLYSQILIVISLFFL